MAVVRILEFDLIVLFLSLRNRLGLLGLGGEEEERVSRVSGDVLSEAT